MTNKVAYINMIIADKYEVKPGEYEYKTRMNVFLRDGKTRPHLKCLDLKAFCLCSSDKTNGVILKSEEVDGGPTEHHPWGRESLQ